IGTLRSSRPEQGAIEAAAAQAHAAGAQIAWQAHFKGSDPRPTALPTYPFQRRRYWVPSALTSASADMSGAGQIPAEHPLLAAAIEAPSEGGVTLTGRLSLSTHPWLADHQVGGTVLLPGTAFLELALKAAEHLGAQTVSELTLQAPLALSEA